MSPIKLLFSLDGRIGRLTYWLFTLATGVIILGPVLFYFGADKEAAEKYSDIACIILFWPNLAVQAKRWHDRDKSAWWFLINFIPIIGFLWALIENGFLAGTVGANRFGEDPASLE